MQIACFDCESPIEAASVDGVVEGFVAHAREVHADWPYPEQALRNFARNYGEAIERLSDRTERLERIGDTTVHRVTEDRLDDWLRFFDHDGFAGNPDWASCYCLEPHEPPTEENPELLWTDRRARMVDRLRTDRTYGYLAYVDGRPAGWVNASLRSDYGLFAGLDPEGPAPESVIGVSCFVVAPPYRGHGIAAALLDRVIADAASRGATSVEGYPRNQPREGAMHFFRGPRSMYDARGFQAIEVRERDTVMRRSV